MKKTSDKLRAVMLVFTFAWAIFSNYFGNAGGWTSSSVGDISDKYNTLITPAGFTFAIWGIIYLGLALFIGHAIWRLSKSDAEVLKRSTAWLSLANIVNGFWIIAWLNELFLLSVVLIFLLLISLIALSIKLRLELWDAPLRTIAFVWWPITLYLGWIVLASVTNVSAWLVSKGSNGGSLGEANWASIMLVVAGAVYLFLIFKRNMREAAGVGIWGIVGVIAARCGEATQVAYVGIAVVAILLIATGIHGYKNRATNPVAKLLGR